MILSKLQWWCESRNIPFILLVLIGFFLPLSIKLTNAVVILFSFTIVLFYRNSIRIGLFQYLVFAFLLIHIVGIVFTRDENIVTGWALIERYTFLFVISVTVTTFMQNNRTRFPVLLLWFVWGTIIGGVWYIFATYFINTDTIAGFEKTAINRVYLGTFTVFAFCAIYWLWSAKKISGAWTILITLLLSIIIAITSSKMPIFLTFLLLCFLFFHHVSKKNYSLILLLCGMLIVFGAFLYSIPEARNRLAYFVANGDSVRVMNWKISLSIIRENFLTGVGTGDALYELNQRRDINWFKELQTYNSHNQYLETWVRTGLFGFLVLLMILVFLLIKAIRPFQWLFCLFLIIMSFAMLTESLLIVQKGIFFFGFFSSVFVAMTDPKARVVESEKKV